MKKNLSTLFVVVLGLSLLLSACGGSSSGGGSGGGNIGSIEIKNVNEFDICQAFVSPVNQDTWGPNQLAAGESVAPGASLKLTNVAYGQYDLKVVSCDGSAEGKMQFSLP
jgi:hypothetical protein